MKNEIDSETRIRESETPKLDLLMDEPWRTWLGLGVVLLTSESIFEC